MSETGGNLVVLQSGGPTPVLNATLGAVIHEARAASAGFLALAVVLRG